MSDKQVRFITVKITHCRSCQNVRYFYGFKAYAYCQLGAQFNVYFLDNKEAVQEHYIPDWCPLLEEK